MPFGVMVSLLSLPAATSCLGELFSDIRRRADDGGKVQALGAAEQPAGGVAENAGTGAFRQRTDKQEEDNRSGQRRGCGTPESGGARI